MENLEAEAQLFKKSPDLITIFTGGAGRIAFGMEVAKKYPNAKIYISGVYNKNTVETLFEKQIKPQETIAEKKLQQSPFSQKPILENTNDESGLSHKQELVEIDYDARNTVENILYTLQYLRSSDENHNVLIISSDYHMLRIKWLMNTIKSPHDHFEFSYLGMKTNFSQWSGIKILIRESLKIIQTGIVLMFWDKENIPHEAPETSGP